MVLMSLRSWSFSPLLGGEAHEHLCLAAHALRDWDDSPFDGMGASMILHPRYRHWLAADTFEGEQVAIPMRSSSPEVELWGCRRELYLGRWATFDAKLEKLGSLRNPEHLAELRFLRILRGSTNDLHLEPEQARAVSRPETTARRLLAEAALATSHDELGVAARMLDQSRELLPDCPESLRPGLRARIARRRAEVIAHGGGLPFAAHGLMTSLGHIQDEPGADAFLNVEPRRRAWSFAWRLLRANQDAAGALRAARESVELDPECPQGRLMLALSSEGPERDAALRTTTRLGSVEAPYARSELQSTEVPPAPVGRDSLPAPDDDPAQRRTIESSVVYRRLRHFWTLEDSSDVDLLPFWARQPLRAWDVWEQGPQHSLSPLYLQSTQTVGIREELARACVPLAFRSSAVLHGVVLADLANASHRMSRLVGALTRPPQDGAAASRVMRLLCYLGFIAEAAEWGQSLLDVTDPTAELLDSQLFARYLLGLDAQYPERARRALARTEPGPPSVRARLAIGIRTIGAAGKLRRVEDAIDWRRRTARILSEYRGLASPEDATLMTARYWRAACFIPMLLGDHANARNEVEHYVALSREVRDASPIHAENMYATLETQGRFFELTGDLPRARRCFEELASEVAPFDAKALVNLGDVLEKQGHARAAAHTFEAAGALGPPLTAVAYHRAGCAWLDAADDARALDCFLDAAEASPWSREPLHGIMASSYSRSREFRWASSQLAGLAEYSARVY